MKRIAPLVFSFTVLFAGCANIPASMPAELQVMLAPEFSMPRQSKIPEDEVIRILAAFAPHRDPKEFVSRIELTSPDFVDLELVPSGPHGNGGATLKKENGKWIYEVTLYPM